MWLIHKILSPIKILFKIFSILEERYFSKNFQYWLFDIITSKDVKLRIFPELSKTNFINKEWEIKGLEEIQLEKSITGFRFGYLNISKSEKEIFINNFKKWINKNLKSIFISTTGIANLYIFCKGLGFLNEPEQSQLYNLISENININKQKSVVLEFCKALNNIEKIKNEKLPINSFEWDKLILRSQYYDHFDNPMNILIYMVNNSDISITEVLISLNPILRTMALEYSLIPTSSNEKEKIIKIMSSKKNEIPFIASLIFVFHNTKPDWLDNEFINKLLQYWEIVICYLIRKAFNDKINKSTTNTLDFIRESINSFLLEKHNDEEFCQLLKWPDDWKAIANWLEFVHEKGDDSKIKEDFHKYSYKSYVNDFSKLSLSIYDGKVNYDNIFSIIIWDIGKPSIKYLYLYLLIGLTKLSEEERINSFKEISKSLYKLKELLFGGFTVKRISLEIIDRFLYLYLCSSNINPLPQEDKDILKELLTKIESTVLFPYIKLRETEEIFWDDNYEPSYYNNLALFWLNEKMKEDNEFVKILKEKVSSISNYMWINN